MVSSAESIAFNIVEGCGAFSGKEFARFLEIAIKSGMELEYQLQLAHENGVLLKSDWTELTRETIEVRRMLCGLRKVVLAKLNRLELSNPNSVTRTQ